MGLDNGTHLWEYTHMSNSTNIIVSPDMSEPRRVFVAQAKLLYPSHTSFTRSEIKHIAYSLNMMTPPAWIVNDPSCRVSRGVYVLPMGPGSPDLVPVAITRLISTEDKIMGANASTMSLATAAVMGMTGGDRMTIVPMICDEYVPWGHFADIEKIIKTRLFAPTYITGMSGNGKTTMIEQVCAKLKRECFRVNIVAETDEDDLLGGFRLENGSTVWQDGPVVQAMRNGAVLLLDEIDLGTSKLMCLQPVLEGKGIYLKKINQIVVPAAGFTVFATANTKGKGSDDGRYIGTNVMNEAMLDRFDYTYEQEYAPRPVEKKIVIKAMNKFGVEDKSFADCLTKWAEMIRKLFAEGSIDEVISTRRLVNIVKAYSVFGEKEKAIRMSLARFDAETSEAFFSAYTKIDGDMVLAAAVFEEGTELKGVIDEVLTIVDPSARTSEQLQAQLEIMIQQQNIAAAGPFITGKTIGYPIQYNANNTSGKKI